MPHVTFIHGIANKPAHDRLLTLWRQSLAANDGLDLGARGISSSMVYWADLLYEKPAEEGAAHESTGEEVVTAATDEDLDWAKDLEGAEAAFVESLSDKLDFDAASPGGDDYTPPADESGKSFERIPLPWFIKRRLMKVLLRDVHHYLFDTEHSPRPGETYRIQKTIRDRFVEALARDAAGNSGGPHVVVSHSMGTVIAYDCLKRVAACPGIDALITVGSPLGIDEVQDKLKPEYSRDNGFPRDKVSGGWANVFDRLDPVAIDTNLANDYRLGGSELVTDVRVSNSGKWRHDLTKYFSQPDLRQALSKALEL
jgi:hypothetical protein